MSFTIGEGPIVCFGEILVRISAPDHELLLQTQHLTANIGGAEANVAVSLSRLGGAARMVSVLPDNPLGMAARDELRRHGVDTGGIGFMPGRMGLYFVTPGAMQRPTEVLYDRAHSAFAEAGPGAIAWKKQLDGASLLHISGVTPAIGAKAAELAVEAVEAAQSLGVGVSFDGNYRSKLWQAWGGDGRGILKTLLATAKLAFVDDRDIALVLETEFSAADPAARRREAASAAFAAFPKLERIASTARNQETVERQEFSASMFARDGGEWRTGPKSLAGVVDRIGSGDAFAAGLLHAMRSGMSDTDVLSFALAAACLKHSLHGDFNLFGEADVKAFLHQNSLDIRR